MKARAAVLVACALLTGCDQLPQALSPSTPPPVPAGPASTLLAQLQIQPEDTGAHYDRDDWMTDWARDGECTTRETVLRQQGQGVVVDGKCAPTAGTWHSSYDGVTTTNPADLEIDHVVPLAEAARSGPVVNGLRQRPGDMAAEPGSLHVRDELGADQEEVQPVHGPGRTRRDRDGAGEVPSLVRVHAQVLRDAEQLGRS